jgi:D12 class N6 adenine-specific DNA methyltransferase
VTSGLKAPFPYFGGKRQAASLVWERFGECRNYIEPFFGSGAVLLNRPLPFAGVETVNDADGLVANFWRALQTDPEAVAIHADIPVNENELHARHAWLVGQKDSLQKRLEGSAEYFDAKIAGWWVWGLCCWIGSGWCSGKGPWNQVNGELVNTALEGQGVKRQRPHLGNAGQGVNRQLPHLGNSGKGVNRKRPHLGDAGKGVNRKRPHLGDAGQGVNRQLPHLGDAGQGVNRQRPHLGDAGKENLIGYMQDLADRLRNVRVCCGDWSRICGPSVCLERNKSFQPTAVFLDPPYADTAARTSDLYRVDSESVAHDVRTWALAHGDDPRYRICLAGYESEHEMPSSWECVGWKNNPGYGSQNTKGYANAKRERLWFSPHCLKPEQSKLALLEPVA